MLQTWQQPTNFESFHSAKCNSLKLYITLEYQCNCKQLTITKLDETCRHYLVCFPVCPSQTCHLIFSPPYDISNQMYSHILLIILSCVCPYVSITALLSHLFSTVWYFKPYVQSYIFKKMTNILCCRIFGSTCYWILSQESILINESNEVECSFLQTFDFSLFRPGAFFSFLSFVPNFEYFSVGTFF